MREREGKEGEEGEACVRACVAVRSLFAFTYPIMSVVDVTVRRSRRRPPRLMRHRTLSHMRWNGRMRFICCEHSTTPIFSANLWANIANWRGAEG